MFKKDLAKDFIREIGRTGGSVIVAIVLIESSPTEWTQNEAIEGTNFCYWVQRFGMEDINDYENELNREVLRADESPVLSSQDLWTQVPLTSQSFSHIKHGSSKAVELVKAAVFLMDEAPKLPKYGLRNMYQLLCANENPNCRLEKRWWTWVDISISACRSPSQPKWIIGSIDQKSNRRRHFNYFSLKKNMRIELEQKEFVKYSETWERRIVDKCHGRDRTTGDILSSGNLIDEIFGNIFANEKYEGMKDRAILTPLSKDGNSEMPRD